MSRWPSTNATAAANAREQIYNTCLSLRGWRDATKEEYEAVIARKTAPASNITELDVSTSGSWRSLIAANIYQAQTLVG
jgi:phage-related tail protein